MAALLSILFFNAEETDTKNICCSGDAGTPSPMRQWDVYKSKFLSGLIRCAGLRHTLGVTDSGCVTSRGIPTGRRFIEKARSFIEWSNDDSSSKGTTTRENQQTITDSYSDALRPLITLYTIFDHLSREFIVNNDDVRTKESSERLATKLEFCHKANNIQELLKVAEIHEELDTICKLYEKGAML